MKLQGVRGVLSAAITIGTLAGCAAGNGDGKPAVSLPEDQAAIEQLIVWADAEPDVGEAPLAVELYCDPLEDIAEPRYSWDPGDGSDSLDGQRVEHTYARPGLYKARVRVRDRYGNIGDDTVEVEVEPKD